MPFIPQSKRLDLENGGQPEVVGDLCYLVYKEMVKQWKENPRWTTAHTIYKSLYIYWPMFGDIAKDYIEGTDFQPAKELAWQVFFQNYVMPYEREKEKENGSI